MKRMFLLPLVFFLLASLPAVSMGGDTGLHRLYVTDSGSSRVSVINTLSSTVIDTIIVGKEPKGITASPDRKKIYVINSGTESSSVSVIDTATNRVTDTIPAGKGPMHMAIDGISKLAYITDTGDRINKSITIIDSADNTVKARKKFKSIEPFEPVIVPDRRIAYVSLTGGYSVAAVNLIDYTTITTIPVGRVPRGLAYDPSLEKIYVSNNHDNTVSIIDVSTNLVTGTVRVGKRPWYIAVDPSGGVFYVTCAGDNSVAVVDTQRSAVVSTIKVGSSPRGITIDPALGKAYVANKLGHSISVIDLKTRNVIKTIHLPDNSHPWSLVII